MPDLHILQRGVEDYQQTFDAMRAFTDARDAATPDQLWLVEHPPVFTLGLGADIAHIIDAHAIPVVQTDRGGEVTYHGPGQAVVYILCDLRREGRARLPREFVGRIEQAVIETLAAYNLQVFASLARQEFMWVRGACRRKNCCAWLENSRQWLHLPRRLTECRDGFTGIFMDQSLRLSGTANY
jgi:lipoate-protein ligase B